MQGKCALPPIHRNQQLITSATALLTVVKVAVTAPVCFGPKAGSETPVLQWVRVGAPAVLTNTTFALLGAMFMFRRLRGRRMFFHSRGSRDVCLWGILAQRFLPTLLQPGLLLHPRLFHLTWRFFLFQSFLVHWWAGTGGNTG